MIIANASTRMIRSSVALAEAVPSVAGRGLRWRRPIDSDHSIVQSDSRHPFRLDRDVTIGDCFGHAADDMIGDRQTPYQVGGKPAPIPVEPVVNWSVRGGFMESTLSPSKTASAIWGRIIKPDQANLTPEACACHSKTGF